MRLNLRSIIIPLLLTIVCEFSFSQARIVIGTASSVYMTMNGGTQTTPICLVLDYNAADNLGISCHNGVTGGQCPTTGIASWIKSEGQYNYVVWRRISSAASGTGYVIPFGTAVGAGDEYVPLTFDRTDAGAQDVLVASTWPSAQNNTPWAGISDDLLGAPVPAVTNMYSSYFGQDGSDEAVIDRWWDIDAPLSTADVTFRYRGTENTMTNGQTVAIAAQHWTGTDWNDGKGGGNGTKTSAGTGATAAVNSATASGLNQFTPYILVAEATPLPVTWLDVSAECNRGDVTIKWSTASEQNSDYFTVERSTDGYSYTDLGNVLAAGQSSTVKNYMYTDTDPYNGVSFYRVKETDFNSSFIYSQMLTVNSCSNDDIFIYGSEGGININIDAVVDSRYNIELYDVLGKQVLAEAKMVPAGYNQLKLFVGELASAMYVVKVYSSNNAVSKKIFVRSAY